MGIRFLADTATVCYCSFKLFVIAVSFQRSGMHIDCVSNGPTFTDIRKVVIKPIENVWTRTFYICHCLSKILKSWSESWPEWPLEWPLRFKKYFEWMDQLLQKPQALVIFADAETIAFAAPLQKCFQPQSYCKTAVLFQRSPRQRIAKSIVWAASSRSWDGILIGIRTSRSKVPWVLLLSLSCSII